MSLDVTKFKRKSISVRWELMFSRALIESGKARGKVVLENWG